MDTGIVFQKLQARAEDGLRLYLTAPPETQHTLPATAFLFAMSLSEL